VAAGTLFLDCDVGLFKGANIDIDPVPQLPFAGRATDAVFISGSNSSVKGNIGRSSVLLQTTSRDGRGGTISYHSTAKNPLFSREQVHTISNTFLI
jgi:hypothetical protein